MNALNLDPRSAWQVESGLRARAQRHVWWSGGVAVLLTAAAAMRFPYLDVPLSADVGGYGTAAWWWARGDALYEGITITRPQGIFVIFRLIDALGLEGTRGVHLFASLWSLLTSVVMLAVAVRVWGRATGLLATALVTLALASPYLQGYDANAELFMALPLLASVWSFLQADDTGFARRRGLLWLAASGALGAAALLLKPSGVVALPLALGWLWYRRAAAGLGWRAWSAAAAALALGFALGLAPALVHGLLTAPDRYLTAVLLYRLNQDSVIAGRTGYQWDYFRTNSAFILTRLPVLLLAPVGLLARQPGAGADDRARDRRVFLWLWTIAAFAGTALGGNWFLHYYQQLLPPLAVAAVLGVRALLRRTLHPGWVALQGLALGCLLGTSLSVLPVVLRPVDATTLPEWEPSIAAVPAVAAYLAANTAPDDAVYVAYDHADIYYLAQRRPAARWLHFRELHWTPGAFDEQVARLADPATAPRYIVGAQPFDRWGFDPDGALRAVVARDYTLETTIGGLPLYRRAR